MNVFSLKFGLSSSLQQPELMQILKSAGAEVIQTGDGLCLKTQSPEDDLKKLLEEKEATGLTLEQLNTSHTEGLSPDIIAFMTT
jgi:hypothetical protein